MLDAKERGRRHGRNAASWAIDPQRMTRDDYMRVVAGYMGGDPAVMDLELNWLSGEWAGESIVELLGDDWTEESAQEYEDAASSAFWAEVLRICELQVLDDSLL